MLNKKIKLWEDQLLDLGKRNKMISFRESKRATLKIFKPGFNELYQRLVIDEQELTFQKAIDKDSDVRVYAILSLLDKLSTPIEVNIGDIKAGGPLPEIQKTLKHLRSKARLSLDEQGTNILYLVFGFIEWREKGSRNDAWIKSPLILVPVSLLLPSLNAQYTLKKYEDEIVVNPTLAYLFDRDYGITLPDFDSDKDTLESFMQKMEKLIDDRGWRIIRDCSLALVSFLKISMYNDLIRHEEQLKQNPIVRAFAGEKNEINTIDEKSFNFDHDACKSIDSFQVLEADSSQQDAIMLSHRGISFVMQGPPGTGKSQTIANIIAQGLADGKKILFVSEKMAALDVVYRRLDDVRLADFCLSLHSYKANKKDVLAQLGSNLNIQKIKVKAEEIAKLSRLDMIKEQLKAYVKDIHTTIMPLEMSLYEVYGAILELGELPDIDLGLPRVECLSKDQVNRLALLVANLDKAQHILGDKWYKNPWQGITISYLEVSQKRELQNKLEDALLVISDLQGCDFAETNLAAELTLDSLDAFLELYSHALQCGLVPHSWFERTTESEERQIHTLFQIRNSMLEVRKELIEKFDDDIFTLPGDSLNQAFSEGITTLREGYNKDVSYEDVFTQLDEDYLQLQKLRDHLALLIDTYKYASETYKLTKQCTFDSMYALLTICGALLEKKTITKTYLLHDGPSKIKSVVSQIRHAHDAATSIKSKISERYDTAILESAEVTVFSKKANEALKAIRPLNWDFPTDYSLLKQLSEFDLNKISMLQNILTGNTVCEFTQTYKISVPATLHDIRQQLDALNQLSTLNVLPRWENCQGRNEARDLINNVIAKQKKLVKEKKKLADYLNRNGILLNTNHFSGEDLEKLHLAHENLPEPDILVSNCQNEEAYAFLKTISDNIEERKTVDSEIEDLRNKYHIRQSISNEDLLDRLGQLRSTAECCSPNIQWVEKRSAAYELLDCIAKLDLAIQTQHHALTDICEDSVFDLDYIGMLNRFKADYTSFLKIFKPSYKEDVKQVRLAFKEVRKKISDEEIISLLQAIRKYHDDLDTYLGYSKSVADLLGVKSYTIGYDWNSVKKRMDVFFDTCTVFEDAKAAYDYLTEGSWDPILSELSKFAELNDWFENNERASQLFGTLYEQYNTNTMRILNLLGHVKNSVTLFSSPSEYLKYIDKPNETVYEEGDASATELVTLRAWFSEKAESILSATGIDFNEDVYPWQKVLEDLSAYENAATLFGDNPTYMICTSAAEQLIAYIEAMQAISKVEEYLPLLYSRNGIVEEMLHVNLDEVLGNLQTIVCAAQDMVEAYGFVSNYCLHYTDLQAEELSGDLSNAETYQSIVKSSIPPLDVVGKELLGENYHGYETDWNLIDEQLQFAEKLHAVFPLVISFQEDFPEELADAFLTQKPIYSNAQIEELRRSLNESKKMAQKYGISKQPLEISLHALERQLPLIQHAIKVKNTVVKYSFVPCKYTQICDMLERLTKVQTWQAEYEKELANAQSMMPTFGLTESTDWGNMENMFSHMKQVKKAVNSGKFGLSISRWITNDCSHKPSEFQKQIEKLVRYRKAFTDFTGLFKNKTTLDSYSLQHLGNRLANCRDQFSTMDAWIDFRDCRHACEDAGLADFVFKAEDVYYTEGTLSSIFLKSFYYAWFEKVSAGIDSVASFRVRTQTSRVKAFCDLDEHQLPVDQMRIRERLTSDMPTRNTFGRATDEMSVLLHELGKKRKIMPLRKLFRTIPNLLLKLKPCLMMSPLSVSYFLEADTYKFDMVIFDEASQIFPQDAIGAIFRGSQVIVAGDSKQLPPTNFFAASTNNDADFDVEDEEEEEIVFDSILEEASNSLPNRSLLWHYRSKFEELISFSNQEIYQNNLITFPSSTTRMADTGVEYVYVKSGVYENRSNRAEAQEIVHLVQEHIKNHPDRSLGVIAFSESQQNIIEDEINKFRIQNPFNETFFDENAEEPFFVKNLENVQGDERDTIIFSICYGKNAQGKMYMYFGPLGHPGGERRLNVAITRAKLNIKLVGSILPDDIDLTRTRSEGVRMLRGYINFAIHGNDALAKHEKKHSLYDVDTFSEQVGQFLMQKGCKVVMNIGSSDYTIDIAVEHPQYPGRYIAGIECDGNTYFMARTVRDREHLRPAALEKMGWNMYRVWSTEWIRNPDAEKERLLQFIHDALQHYDNNAVPVVVPDPHKTHQESIQTEVVRSKRRSTQVNVKNPYDLDKYIKGDGVNHGPSHGKGTHSQMADMIHAVVKIEQPIHRDLLYKRIGELLNSGRITPSIRDTIDNVLKNYMANELVIEDGFIRLADCNMIRARMSPIGEPDRTIEYISIPEIAAAMEKVLVGTYGMERSVLCSEAARVFGFERNGAKIKQRTNEAVNYLVANHKVTVCDDKVQLLEK